MAIRGRFMGREVKPAVKFGLSMPFIRGKILVATHPFQQLP
jgi:hypothetical protein